MTDVLIVGGGAAGLMAGISAQAHGAQSIICEKMPDVGRKMLITGKGRCNVTNNGTIEELIANMTGNGRFLYSAFNHFSNEDLMALITQHGLALKVERGKRVFPASDRARDVVDLLRRMYVGSGGRIYPKATVKEILLTGKAVRGVRCISGREYLAPTVLIATGGASYPLTGSTGDGQKMAQQVGHSIVPLRPSLVPLTSDSEYLSQLQGLSLRNVRAQLLVGEKVIASEFGEMLFTHFGLSGPIILSLSRHLVQGEEMDLLIDLKPALSLEQLEARVKRDLLKYSRKKLTNALVDLLPSRLIPVVLDAAYLTGEEEVNQLKRAERTRIVETLKGLSFHITGTRPLAEAIVTAGGVATTQINPRTMESRLIKGLYFAGEVMDVDGFTGGYNLQAAFSTGYCAGEYAAYKAKELRDDEEGNHCH